MFADKTLLLKGLAGVAAVGAAGGGTFIFRKELGLVDSSNNANDAGKGTPEEDGAANQDHVSTEPGSGAQTEEQQNAEQLAQKQAEEIKKQKEAKKSKVNEQLTKLGLEFGCHLDITNFSSPTEFSKECELDQTKLQKIHFSNKGEADVTVSGLDGNIKLKIANKETDKVSYKFSGASSKITISGDSTKPDIVLNENVEREFEEKEDKLSKISQNTPEEEEKIKELNKKLETLKIPDKCRFDEKENDENSIECNLNKTELQRIPFSNKGNSEVTVTGLDSGSIKLKIEKKNNNSKLGFTFSDITSKLTISGDPTKPDIVLKENVEREFEERDGNKLGKVAKDSTLSSKIKGLNQKLSTIKIPDKCRFEEEDNETSLQCNLSNQDDLKKIEFLSKESDKPMTITGSTDGLKLTVNRFEDDAEGPRKYKTDVDLEFFFSGYKDEVKIQGGDEFNINDISLKPKITTLFTITNSSSGQGTKNKLAKYFDASTMATKLNISCTKDSSSSSFKCTPWDENHKIKFLNSAGDGIEEIAVGSKDKDTQILTATENTENYELGIKFTGKINFPSTNSKIQANAGYEPKYIKGKG